VPSHTPLELSSLISTIALLAGTEDVKALPFGKDPQMPTMSIGSKSGSRKNPLREAAKKATAKEEYPSWEMAS
jgi:hypothetical protein